MSLACRCGGWSSSTGSACCATSSGGTPSTGWSTRTWSPLSRSRTPSTCAAPPPSLRSAAEAQSTAQVNVDELQKQFNFGAPPDASPPPRNTWAALSHAVCVGCRGGGRAAQDRLHLWRPHLLGRGGDHRAVPLVRLAVPAGALRVPRAQAAAGRAVPDRGRQPLPLVRRRPVPTPDVALLIAAGWLRFGTQALDKNFARQLCPYYYFKKKDGDKKGGEGAAKEGAGEAAAGTPAGDAREEDEVRVQAAALLAVADARAHAGLRSSGRRWRRRRPTSR